ncbi:small acid-soluble spore protein Tlp [Aeribacillus kexueae]|uniref:small acid-soluble spore protein Tlp n=1 Tax=Aeribacillus kexueae TaxID=2078952 RepID=UPI003AF114E4
MMPNYKPNPDDRSDNVEKLQSIVQNTLENIEEAEETLRYADEEERERIQAKNARREESIQSLREEIRDEATDRESGFRNNDEK